jgi:hypothetical protein
MVLLVIAGVAVAKDPKWAQDFLERKIVPVLEDTAARTIAVAKDAYGDLRFVFEEVAKRLREKARTSEKNGERQGS